MKKYFVVGLILVVFASGLWLYFYQDKKVEEKIVGINTKDDLIEITSPLSGDAITSPVKITGKARGNWYFEASFPVFIVDWDGLIIAQGIATAKEDWMTTEYVPFEAELTFEKPSYKNNGAIILKKDNPSGLPENDNALEIPITFK